MKRDMDLVREILLCIEDERPIDSISGSPIVLVRQHLKLLIESGYVKGEVLESLDVADPIDFFTDGLTWTGHDFLDAARSDTVWNKAKERITSTGVSVTVEMLKRLLIKIGESQLGL